MCVCFVVLFEGEKIKTPHRINTLVKNAHRIYSLLQKNKQSPQYKKYIQKLTKEKIQKEKIHSIIFSHKKENHFLWMKYADALFYSRFKLIFFCLFLHFYFV